MKASEQVGLAQIDKWHLVSGRSQYLRKFSTPILLLLHLAFLHLTLQSSLVLLSFTSLTIYRACIGRLQIFDSKAKTPLRGPRALLSGTSSRSLGGRFVSWLVHPTLLASSIDLHLRGMLLRCLLLLPQLRHLSLHSHFEIRILGAGASLGLRLRSG